MQKWKNINSLFLLEHLLKEFVLLYENKTIGKWLRKL